MPVKRASAVRTRKANVWENLCCATKSPKVGTHGVSPCLCAGEPAGPGATLPPACEVSRQEIKICVHREQ